jgi:hypothetical protein
VALLLKFCLTLRVGLTWTTIPMNKTPLADGAHGIGYGHQPEPQKLEANGNTL